MPPPGRLFSRLLSHSTTFHRLPYPHIHQLRQVECRYSYVVHSSRLHATTTRTFPRASRSSSLAVNLSWVAGLITSLAFYTYSSQPAYAEAKSNNPADRLIRLEEIHQHNRSAGTYWVYRGDRVYDVTEWVPNHPGGDVILRAVGGSIEPYWNIFTIHQNQDVYDILEQYFIGKIDPQDLIDGQPPRDRVDDPFKTDPTRDPSLLVHTQKPFNAETPASELEEFITPTEKFYVRHHLWVPQINDPKEYRLTVELPDGEEVSYSLADLREKFQQHTITATMQCSGNRRAHMTKNARHAQGLQWDVGAISNAEWTGVRLRDVLAASGFDVANIPDDIKHAQFTGLEAYGASIPIEKACDQHGDVLLAHRMNGHDLPRDHGYPLRALVPGTVAARSVKWLQKIALTEDESSSQWQRRDYKCFGPNVSRDPDWASAPAIQETPVQSAITSLRRVSADRLQDTALARVYGLEEDSVLVAGYAFAGGGRRIVRVDVSPDDGRTWAQAVLGGDDGEEHRQKGHKAWSWQQWRIAIPVNQLRGKCCVRAVDEAYNTQPESYEPNWNLRGNLTNTWHRVPVNED